MVIPIPPAKYLAELCLKNISEQAFNSTCFAILESTTLAEKQLHYIEQSEMAIGVLSRYLHGNEQTISAGSMLGCPGRRNRNIGITRNGMGRFYLFFDMLCKIVYSIE